MRAEAQDATPPGSTFPGSGVVLRYDVGRDPPGWSCSARSGGPAAAGLWSCFGAVRLRPPRARTRTGCCFASVVASRADRRD